MTRWLGLLLPQFSKSETKFAISSMAFENQKPSKKFSKKISFGCQKFLSRNFFGGRVLTHRSASQCIEMAIGNVYEQEMDVNVDSITILAYYDFSIQWNNVKKYNIKYYKNKNTWVFDHDIMVNHILRWNNMNEQGLIYIIWIKLKLNNHEWLHTNLIWFYLMASMIKEIWQPSNHIIVIVTVIMCMGIIS